MNKVEFTNVVEVAYYDKNDAENTKLLKNCNNCRREFWSKGVK